LARFFILKAADHKNMENKSKKILIIAVLVIALAAVITLAFLQGRKSSETTVPTVSRPAAVQTGVDGVALTEDGDYAPTEANAWNENEALAEAVVVVPGANPIAKDNTVLTAAGEVARNDAMPSAPDAPRQTQSLDAEKLPAEVIRLEISAATGYVPNEFTVKAGAPITISLTNNEPEKGSHGFVFLDQENLSAIAMSVRPGETRAITFNAPTEPGEYGFRCGIPGHSTRGEVGTMIVE